MLKNGSDRMQRAGQNRVIELSMELEKQMARHRGALLEVEQAMAGLRNQCARVNGDGYDLLIKHFAPLQAKRDLLSQSLQELAKRYEEIYLPALRERVKLAFSEQAAFNRDEVSPLQHRYYEILKPAAAQTRSNLLGPMAKEEKWKLQRRLADQQADVIRGKVELEIAESKLQPLSSRYETLRKQLRRAERTVRDIKDRDLPVPAGPVEVVQDGFEMVGGGQ